MVIRAGLSSKSLTSIARCFTAKYLSWMNDFHKFSIVSCSLSTSAAHSLLAAPFNPSSVMAVVSALFVFLKFFECSLQFSVCWNQVGSLFPMH